MTEAQLADLILVAKDTNDKLSSRICRRLGLGIDVSIEFDMLYLLQNCLFALDIGTLIFDDDDYNDLLEKVNIIYNKCNKFW